MGAIGGLLGTAGGVNGTGISGPNQANIQQGVNTEQTGAAYTGAQRGLADQQALLNALQQQGGIGKQAAQYQNTQNLGDQLNAANGVGTQNAAVGQQQALNQALAANNGAANLGQVYGQSQGLAGQLAGANAVANQSGALNAQQQLAAQQQATAQQYQNIANGTGPNPAQAALNNATGANVANQAALMAGQRGAGSNVGLMARQAAQQGAATQQQAVGQSAEMQAQQQLAGLSGLTGQQQAIGGTNQSVANIAGQQLAAQQAQQQALAGQAAQQVGLQQAGTNAQMAQGAQQVAQQQAQMQAAAQQAAQMANQQMGATNSLSQGYQNEQGQLLGGLNAQNSAEVSSQGNINSANASMANTNMQGQQSMLGGLMNPTGLGAKLVMGAAPAAAAAEGGMITHMAAGGPAIAPMPMTMPQPGPTSSFGQFLSGWAGPQSQGGGGGDDNFTNLSPGPNKGAEKLADAMSKSGQWIPPSSTPAPTSGPEGSSMRPQSAAPMMNAKGGLASSGGHVAAKTSAQKAVKSGNSYSNDKIPALLSEGEIVIPRNILQSADPVAASADFVSKIMAKRGKK